MESRPVQTRAHHDGVDRWEIVDAQPAPALCGRVARYWSYSEHTRSFTARRELAGTTGVLIYVLDAPLELVGADGQPLTVRAGEAFVGGISNATSVSRAWGPQAGVHVFLPLDSLACLIRAPLAEIANRVVPLQEFAGGTSRDLGSGERFAGALTAAPREGMAALAADAGYVDQAHLARDVRDFSDMTPGELRARLLPAAGGVRD